MKINRIYVTAFIVLFAMETFIAIYVHDAIVRPYVGDILVVILLYAAVRGVWAKRVRLLPLYLFLFAFLIEGLQYLNLLSFFYAEGNIFLRIVLGSVFDWKDILCYGIGCFLLGLYEIFLYRLDLKKIRGYNEPN